MGHAACAHMCTLIIHTCMHSHAHTEVQHCTHTHACVDTRIHNAHTHLRAHTCTPVFSVCFMRCCHVHLELVCVGVVWCESTPTHTNICTHTYTNTHTDIHKHTQTHKHAHTYTHKHRHTQTQTHTHTPTLTHKHTHLHKYPHVCSIIALCVCAMN